jgi:hypothetical protein
VEGSNISVKYVKHLVHNSRTAPGYLLRHSALCTLGVIFDYGKRTITCGDATFRMPSPHKWAPEATSFAANIKHAEWETPTQVYAVGNTIIRARTMQKVSVQMRTDFGPNFTYTAHIGD